MIRRYRLLATGGTIASVAGENGLRPAVSAKELLARVPLPPDVEIIGQDVFSLDSSNIQPEEWRVLAKAVYSALEDCDGVLVTHGTDTLAYTAAALSFMLTGLQKPVVLTGSQLPLLHPLSDAPVNFLEALSVLGRAPAGVFVSFHHKVILGVRAVKTRTTSFNAFHSVNAPLAGEVDSDGVHMRRGLPCSLFNKPRLADEIDPRVFLLKLMPGTSPDVLDFVMERGYKGLVLEAFGLGGLHFIRRNLVDKLRTLTQKGIVTLVTTQCIYEKADFSIYEVGRQLLSAHVYSAMDMTTEAAVTKLMWVLGDPDKRMGLLTKSLCGEMGGWDVD